MNPEDFSCQGLTLRLAVGQELSKKAPFVNVENFRHFHPGDIAANRIHQHLIPSNGANDFAATHKEMNKDGWITIELYPFIDDPDQAARTALERVRALVEQK